MPGTRITDYQIQSCGKRHAWCGECRPDLAAAQRKPGKPLKQYVRACRNCGSCDACLGLTAPEGQKVCRTCRAAKPIESFTLRGDTGGRRNQCIKCRNDKLGVGTCENCNKGFTRHSDQRTLCGRCRPPLTKPCLTCGAAFVGSMDQRRYCSTQCRETANVAQRKVTWAAERLEILRAYSGPDPFCACCGETILTFLALDHIDGRGHAQRKELGGGGFNTWLRREGFPAGFRVLCHNCNHGRELNGGICPHDVLVRELVGV